MEKRPSLWLWFVTVAFAVPVFPARANGSSRALSLPRARQLARSPNGEIPIVVDKLVLKELNHLVGTRKGRAFLMSGLSQMPRYQSFVTGKLREYDLPLELRAIPLVESGYRNLTADESRGFAQLSPGAGLWMFVSKTARRFGLQVDVSLGVDERLHVRRQTDAAMSLFRFLYRRFDRDWGLALAAYNQGEGHVQRAINETGVRDAWELARRGKINRYLSRVAATMIVLKHPQLLR